MTDLSTDVDLGSIDDLTQGAGTKFTVGGTDVAVFRIGDEVFAIADRCSHAEASLSEGELFGTDVECPRHGAEFDVTTGRQLSLPATKPVRSYPTRVVEGEIYLTVDSEEAHD